ncbi:MAG: SGNH/GDSL hydrolase family protein [Planctomycetes bacterium]|nr:SGNH/GDSL hydrolase family protein [Planctomycetota bacterium]
MTARHEGLAPPKRRRLGPLLAVVSFALSLLAVEFGFRALYRRAGIEEQAIVRAREAVTRRRASYYEPMAYYGWLLAQAARDKNQYGFYGEEWALERKPGVLRIACLGGSTTAGGNPYGYHGSYPFFLREQLTASLGREIEVMNCGISGWTTAEMTCAWFLLLQDFRPDLVIMHEVANDSEPRNHPGFRPDYAHWRGVWSVPPAPAPTRWLVEHSDFAAWLRSREPLPSIHDATVLPPSGAYTFTDGRLPQATLAPFRRNVLSIGASQAALGGAVMLATLPTQPPASAQIDADFWRAGIAEHNQAFRELAAQQGWLLADLERLAADAPDLTRSHFIDLVHVDREGNAWKAACIAQVLVRNWKPLVEQLAARQR